MTFGPIHCPSACCGGIATCTEYNAWRIARGWDGTQDNAQLTISGATAPGVTNGAYSLPVQAHNQWLTGTYPTWMYVTVGCAATDPEQFEISVSIHAGQPKGFLVVLLPTDLTALLSSPVTVPTEPGSESYGTFVVSLP